MTNDGGNGGGGPLIDVDQVTIHLNTHLIGTPSDDSYTALPGNERIDAGGGNDTVYVRLQADRSDGHPGGNKVIIDGPVEPHVLTGFEIFAFTDGTVRQQ